MTIRANKFMKLGTPTVPFDLSAAGLVLIQGGTTNTPYTGTIVTTEARHHYNRCLHVRLDAVFNGGT